MRSLLKYFFKSKRGAVLQLINLLCLLICSWCNVLVIKNINIVMSSETMNGIKVVLVLLTISSAASILSTWSRRVANKSTYSTILGMFSDKILDMNYDMFTKYSCGTIITVSESINGMCEVINMIINLTHKILSIVMILFTMYTIVPTIIIPYVSLYGVMCIVVRIGYSKFDRHHKTMADIRRSRNQEIDEIINGFGEVRSFNTQLMHKLSIQKKSDNINSIIVRLANTVLISDIGANIAYNIGVVIAMYYAYIQMKAGVLTLALGISLVTYSMQITNKLLFVLDTVDYFADKLSQMDKFDEIMNSEIIKDGIVNLNSFDNSITVDDVSFRYDDSDTVLNHISLNIKKGDKIGICGPSGGGKTTFLKLLMRFYDPSEGKILIDGINLKDFSIDSVGKHLGIVSQDVYIFNSTIRENISYGTMATDCEIVEAAGKAGILDYIQSLPDRFETIVGPKGLKLSGGQKQRISLARVFLKNPDIILLDESTSALDNESENIVQQSLKLLNNKTTITIAHRLSTIRESDKIVVLSNHTIAGVGTHRELLETCDEYIKLNK